MMESGWKCLSSPRAKRAGPKGLRAESARAVTGRRNSHRWEGGRLFEPSAGFFYGNSCNFGTESRKIVSKVGNQPSCRGLKMGHQRKLGSYGKNRIFGPKTKILSPKKGTHFLPLTMFWPRPKKVVQRKKGPLPK